MDSDWLLRPACSASSVPGFLATQTTRSQVQTQRVELHAKYWVLLGLLYTFKAKSWCVYRPSASLFATYLFWEWSASGVDDVCVVVFEFWSGRRPRGCRPWSVRGRSVPRRSGNKPSLLRFISEYGQLTCLQTRQKKKRSQFRDTNTFTLSAHTNKVRFF